jgi:hypothetical protein
MLCKNQKPGNSEILITSPWEFDSALHGQKTTETFSSVMRSQNPSHGLDDFYDIFVMANPLAGSGGVFLPFFSFFFFLLLVFLFFSFFFPFFFIYCRKYEDPRIRFLVIETPKAVTSK